MLKKKSHKKTYARNKKRLPDPARENLKNLFTIKLKKMKNLKTSLIVLVIAFSICYVKAQAAPKTNEKNGLYVTYSDFKNHKLSYTGNRISLNTLFGSGKINIITNNQKISLLKKDVFGFHDAKEGDYRFYKNELYKVVDAGEGLCLYYASRLEEINKGKGLVKTDEYFFSVSGNSEIYLLTMANLKKAFPDNNKFHYSLDATFKSDKDLMAYDSYSKMYKVKYLYNESLK